ncbi:MAG: hypothetical protein JXA21_28390 [Anaerolineae bacterium]|nr:hypothetical protein [Anaerolineae bacterium]
MAKNRTIAIIFLVAGISIILILAVIMMILGRGLLATLLLGASLILGGVIGLVIGRQSYPVEESPPPTGKQGPPPTVRQSPPPDARQSASHPAAPSPAKTSSPATTTPAQATQKMTSGGIRGIADMVVKAWNAKDFGTGRIPARMMLIGSGVLVLIAVLLLCNLMVALRPLLIVHETQVVECRKASIYTEDGWKIVSSYSYQVDDPEATVTIYNACVIERERFVWVKETRPEKTKKADFGTRRIMPDSSSSSTLVTSTPTPQKWPTIDVIPTDDTQTQQPTATLQPTATVAPTIAPPTITPLPSATPFPTPLPTVTPESPDSPIATPIP